MHTLRIENNRLFLDDKELERVQGYALTPITGLDSLEKAKAAMLEVSVLVELPANDFESAQKSHY